MTIAAVTASDAVTIIVVEMTSVSKAITHSDSGEGSTAEMVSILKCPSTFLNDIEGAVHKAIAMILAWGF